MLAADIDPTYSSGVHRFLICGVNPIVARVRFAYGQPEQPDKQSLRRVSLAGDCVGV